MKPDAKQVVLPHSQAKLDLYKNYLQHYLRVLGNSPYFSKINLYDIFCGIGKYEDGNEGSPLITNNCIKESIGELMLSNKPLKQIHVTINDKEKDKVDNVKQLLSGEEIRGCNYRYFNLEADRMLDIVASEINSFSSSERNLVFIDPYGYSNITKDKLYDLLRKEATEVILFLPISQMYRFTEIALNDFERSCYDNLRRFITNFFPLGHRIHVDGMDNNLDFVYALKQALTFNDQFFSCSHYIERGKGNYYALFFITSNIYGLEKMVDAKWKLDPIKGKGFDQKKDTSQIGLFQEHFEDVDKMQHLDFLKALIIGYLQSHPTINNYQVYELALKNEFTPSKAINALKDLLKGRRIVSVDDIGNVLEVPLGFYTTYQHHKKKEIKIAFKLIK